MTREHLGHAVRASAQSENQRHRDNIVELYDDHQCPHAEAPMNSTHDRAYRVPPSDEWPNRRRGRRDISPWSSSSVDGGEDENDDDDDDDGDAFATASATAPNSRQEASTIRRSLLAESATDNRKVRLLQDWVRDYGDIIRQIRMLNDSGAVGRGGSRDYENDRLQDLLMDAVRIELGPRSITDPRDRIASPFNERLQRPVVRINANNERMYGPPLREERRRLPERSRGSEDDSSGASRNAQYGECRQPIR